MPKETIEFPHGVTNRTEIEYRLAWTRTFMKKVGILENSFRGVWALGAKAHDLQEIDPKKVVKQVREMSFLKLSEKDNTNVQYIDLKDANLENDGVDVPDEIKSWRDQLRNVLYNLKPDAFERLTQRILRESGFVQVEVTGRTGDGGIDGTGIIRLNGIISFHMLFQCKRYKGTVSPSEIRDFRGAMQGRSDKGLFITTGNFSSAAVNEANRAGTTPIDLIDGDKLLDKLRELELGVVAVTDYSVDESWFLSL